MKKTINVTIDEDDWKWLKSNHINISSWVRALMVKERNKHNDIIVNEKVNNNNNKETLTNKKDEKVNIEEMMYEKT
tara:strand:- start:566 stop:793 length:228 start_codon:yes stop_codon:yes gene_type:complete